MVGHARRNERIDKSISRNFMTGLLVKEVWEEGNTVLIVRVSKDEHWNKTKIIGKDC